MIPRHKASEQLVQLKVTLDGVEPAVWRRIVVPSDASLYRLHEVIQTVMCWTNSHLHQYSSAAHKYTIPDEDTGRGVKDERRFTVARLIHDGPPWVYEYDFGDGWRHRIEFERAFQAGPDIAPRCLDGARACPPEDVGGSHGYQEFLEAINDLRNERHDELLEWIGGAFDAAAFDAEKINAALTDVWAHGLPVHED